MSENERPLPSPPRTRFGRSIPGEEQNAGPLTADRLTQADAEGRLEEVLQHEIPEGEHARNLALMMLGMSGMMPSGMPGMPAAPAGSPPAPPDPGTGGPFADPAALAVVGGNGVVPPEVLAATMQGDVAGLAALLRAEHERRRGGDAGAADVSGDAPGLTSAIGVGARQPAPAGPAEAAGAGIDKALVDDMIRIAADNQVTVDWLLLRAVKLYLEEHRKTGRL